MATIKVYINEVMFANIPIDQDGTPIDPIVATDKVRVVVEDVSKDLPLEQHYIFAPEGVTHDTLLDGLEVVQRPTVAYSGEPPKCSKCGKVILSLNRQHEHGGVRSQEGPVFCLDCWKGL